VCKVHTFVLTFNKLEERKEKRRKEKDFSLKKK